jgi:hypothetical protein
MGYIKEPVGVDLNIGPMPFSDEERQSVSAIIAQYKSTGEVPKFSGKAKVTKKKKLSASNAIDRSNAGKSKLKKKAIPTSELGK